MRIKPIALSLALLFGLAAGCRKPDSGFVYVSNEDSGTLSVISTDSHEVVATIEVGKRPRGVRVGRDGKHVYVALSGSPKCPPWMSEEDCEAQVTDKSLDGIAVVDVAARRVLEVLPGGSDPEQFDLSLDGKNALRLERGRGCREHRGRRERPDREDRSRRTRTGRSSHQPGWSVRLRYRRDRPRRDGDRDIDRRRGGEDSRGQPAP